MATTTWVAGLYNEVTLQPAPAARAAIFGLPECEDFGGRMPILPALAEQLYGDLFGYKLWEVRAGLSGIAEFDARLVLPPQAPLAFDEVEWQRFAGAWISQTTSEAETGLTPIVPGRAWDETEWQRTFAWFAAYPGEDEQPERLPFTPPPVPNLGWDDFEWNHDFGARGLAMLVVMDDFVNAPAGGGTGGGAPRGRAARLGLAMPAFR
jgi:hypothetical protein